MNLDKVKKFALGLTPDAIDMASSIVKSADGFTQNFNELLDDVNDTLGRAHTIFTTAYVNFDDKIKLAISKPLPIITTISVACVWVLTGKVVKR